MKLYETNKKLEEILDIENPEDRQLALGKLEMTVQSKINTICRKCVNWDSDIASIDSQIERLTELKRIRQNKRKWLSDFLKYFMENNDLKKIDLPEFTASVVKCPASVEITRLEAIPEEYIITKTTKQADKNKIKKALQEGFIVSGAVLIENKTALRIK
jgi:hypothetical protein